MDPYSVLADHYARSTLPDLAHSALPTAPRQPLVERRGLLPWLRAVLHRRSGLRRRAAVRTPARRAVTPQCTAAPIRSPRTITGG
jgi:hypothetical protein